MWRLLLHVVILVLGAITLATIAGGLGLGAAARGGLSALSTLGAAIVVGLGTWLAARVLDRRSFQSFGLHLSPRWWADLGAGFVIGAALMTGIFGVELAAGWIHIEGTFVGAGELPFALAFIDPTLTFIAVGFYEELLSRGYHLRNLAEGLRGSVLGPRAALAVATLVSASVFGLLHVGNDNATLMSTVNVGLAGCMLAAGLLWTGELGLPIGLHLSWNLFQGNVFGFPVSGNPMRPRVFDIEQGGEALITGAGFGPEAGLIGVLAMLAGVGLTAAWVRATRGDLRICIGDREPSSSAR